MKKFLFALALLSSVIAKSQELDSTKVTLQQLKDAVVFMRENDKHCHRQFSDGATVAVLGAAAMFVSPFCSRTVHDADGVSHKDYEVRNIVFVAGSLIELAGIVTIVDSHKFIGRNGHWKFTGNSIVLDWK